MLAAGPEGLRISTGSDLCRKGGRTCLRKTRRPSSADGWRRGTPKDLDAAEELLAPEFVRHDANLPDVVGPQAERQHIADDLAAARYLVLQQLGAVPGPG
jgi:hypothetical protein